MKKIALIFGVLYLLIMIGCSSSGTSVAYVDPDSVETVTADFGSTDLKMITTKMVNSLLGSGILDGRPIIFVDRVKNKTHEHIDTKSITDKIRTTLLKHGKVRVTGRSDIPESIVKELDFQQSNLADPKTAARIGKLAGAKYILFGEISSIVKRNEDIKDVWFKITLNLVEVETGLIEWADDKEIRKQAEQDSVGW